VRTDRGIRVASGTIVVLRLYDVAHSIDLAQVTALVATPVSRIRLSRVQPKAMSFGVPPLELRAGSVAVPVDDIGSADVVARIYDFGVITMAVRISARDLPWDAYVERVNLANEWAAREDGEAQLASSLRSLLNHIGPATFRPTEEWLTEDYLIATVQSFEPPLSAQDVVSQCDVQRLLSGEARLAEAEQAELLRHRFSYTPDDLVVLTWDRAFVLEPAGDNDVADVLEVANVQLLELRYYDEWLDEELPRVYDRVEIAHKGFRALARHRYARLARQLHAMVAEVTEITEHVDNVLKVTEDVYLARIYGTALQIFRIESWGRAVDRKLAFIRETYAALYDDAATARAELLEATIVLLIVFEVILAFFI